MDVFKITDLSHAFIGHRVVSDNLMLQIGTQLRGSSCRCFGDGQEYQWEKNDNKIVIPDFSIVCKLVNFDSLAISDTPRLVVEVLSMSTEKYDRTRKMEIYAKVGVPEYWLVDWRKKEIEIYILNSKSDKLTYKLHMTVSKDNKRDLKIVMLPHLKVDFDGIFE